MEKSLFTVLLLAVFSACQEVRFSEVDYRIGSDASIFTFSVAKLGTTENSFTITVYPLTLSAYERQFPNFPCGSVESILSDGSPAEENDFNTTVLQREVTAGIDDDYEFSISIFQNDGTLEATEIFLIYLSVSDNNVSINRPCATGRIAPSIIQSDQVVRLERASGIAVTGPIEIIESAGTIGIFNIVKTILTNLTINIGIEATGGNADYMLPSKTLAITKNDHNAIVNVIIRDDVLAEEYKEHYTLEFRVTVPDTGITNHPIGSKMFTIVDDEVVLVGLAGGQERSVMEGNSIEICVTLQNVTTANYLRFNDRFELSTSEYNNGARANEDFVPLVRNYTPSIDGNERCFTIVTSDNNETEEAKYFRFAFQNAQETNLTKFGTTSIRIAILDNDGIPLAPVIESIRLTETKTLIVSWSAESNNLRQIETLNVTVRVGRLGRLEMDRGTFPSNSEMITFEVGPSAKNYEIENYEEDKKYEVVICAVNSFGRNCSDPKLFEKVSEPDKASLDNDVSSGIIAVIILSIALFLFICFLFILLIYIFYKRERGKSYFPGKVEGKDTVKAEEALEDSKLP